MKPIFFVIAFVCTFLFLTGCASNATDLTGQRIAAQTTSANQAIMNNEGEQSANFYGVSPSHVKQDAEGNWITTPGPGGLLSYNPMTGMIYLWSPKDAILEDVQFTPNPVDGQPGFSAARIDLNISTPAAVFAEQYNMAMTAVEGMTRIEAERRVAELQAAGQITADVASAVITALNIFMPTP